MSEHQLHQQQQRHRQQRNGIHKGASYWNLLILLAGTTAPIVSEAFVPTARTFSPSSSSLVWRKMPVPPVERALRLPSRKRMTEGLNWEEFIYNAESVASQWASTVLHVDSVVGGGVSSGSSASWWSSLPIMYGAGLLTSVSPCVWGLLPLTMSYISTAAGEREDQQATVPTLLFAAGLASVFCGMGLIAATVGTLFGSSGSSDDWTSALVPVFSSGICVIMGLQLLDLIHVPLPSLDFLTPRAKFRPVKRRLQPTAGGDSSLFIVDGTATMNDSSLVLRDEGSFIELTSSSDTDAATVAYQQQQQQRQMDERGSLFRTFLLGGSSALVASPCATPVLTSILAYVANEHSPVLGAVFLFCYTLGYATPLLLVAATGGQFLVNMRNKQTYGKIAPWVTPMTAGVLLWYGTSGVLTAVFGDPSLAGLAPLLE